MASAPVVVETICDWRGWSNNNDPLAVVLVALAFATSVDAFQARRALLIAFDSSRPDPKKEN